MSKRTPKGEQAFDGEYDSMPLLRHYNLKLPDEVAIFSVFTEGVRRLPSKPPVTFLNRAAVPFFAQR